MTANSRLHDAAVDHAVDLVQYQNGIVRRIIALLNRVDSDLIVRLTDALEGLPASSATVERLDALLTSVRELNARAYRDAGQELTDELRRLVDYEAGYQLALFQSAIPPQVAASVGLAAVQAEQVYAAAMSRPFQGRLLREWARDIEADRMRRIRDAVRMGFTEQETIPQIVRRVRGTRARGYADGIIEIDRRAAEAVVRTAVSHTAGFTRDRFYEANDDLVKAVQWTATLDTRTSEGCRIRDGLRYTTTEHKPIGHSIPWAGGPGRLHWQCRSTAVPITKSWRELGLDIDDFSPTERASMDGTVPADQTFAGWIKRQSASRQNEVLGETRAKLMRDGGLPLDRFYNDKGRYLSLDELRAKDAKAFARAGLGD
jgi:hypothetical protein